MFDDTDLRIVNEFLKLNGEEKTGWKIMKCLFKGGGNKENNKIYYKLKRLSSLGLFQMTHNSPKSFILDPNKIFKRCFLLNGKKVSCICLLIDDRYQIFQFP